MKSLDQLKNQIGETIDEAREEILRLSAEIHSHPETGYQEFQAVKHITGVLKNHGLSVKECYGNIPTSFRAEAVKSGKKEGPVVAILAEYDALDGIGHGCGHNVIAACAAGAFLGASSVMDRLDGSVCLIGTPAEEGGAGKVKLLENGAFDDVDFAVMMHPSGADGNLSGRGGRAACTLKVTFWGKGAHSSAPRNGINALNAVISLFCQIDMMRPTFEIQDNINGIITKGGTAANAIPETAECQFCIRAATMKRIRELIDFIRICTDNAGRLTGARGDVFEGAISAERYPNRPMCESFKRNMESLGVTMHWADSGRLYGSSDIGNVSIRLPAIHEYLSITDDPQIQAHTAAYARAAQSEKADEICILGAKGLAMTACDILSDKGFREEIRAYHKAQVPEFYQKSRGNE
ncbi:M20 family metallopeptidase [Lachnospiraceae bacterium 54-53]